MVASGARRVAPRMMPTVPSTKEPVLVEKQRQQERRMAIMHLLCTMINDVKDNNNNDSSKLLTEEVFE